MEPERDSVAVSNDAGPDRREMHRPIASTKRLVSMISERVAGRTVWKDPSRTEWNIAAEASEARFPRDLLPSSTR